MHAFVQTNLKISNISAGECAMKKYLQVNGGILHDTYLQ